MNDFIQFKRKFNDTGLQGMNEMRLDFVLLSTQFVVANNFSERI